MRIIAWKAAADALATDQNKVYHHLTTVGRCWVCGRENEGTYHALVTCPQARCVWQAMRSICPLLHDDILVDNGKEWLLHVLAACNTQG